MNGRAVTNNTDLNPWNAMASARWARQSKATGSVTGLEALGEIDRLPVDRLAVDHNRVTRERCHRFELAAEFTGERLETVAIEDRILAHMRLGIEPIVELVALVRKA